MKDEIKKFIIDAGILYPNFNRNVARKRYWDNRNTEWSKYIYEKFDECNKICRIHFADFLRYFFFDEQIQYYYHDTEFFLTNTISLQHNPGTRLYNAFFEDGCRFVDFTPVSMTELIYCFRNDIRSRPKCKECSNDTAFTIYKTGYRLFCSQKCQLVHNNKVKEIKRSNNTVDEIREIISNTPADLRNLTNYNISNNFINILEHTSEFKDVPVRERIYIFLHNITVNDTLCFCGDKKGFASQVFGYKKTCGRINCINLSKNNQHFNNNEYNIRTSKSGGSYESGFIYILKSDSCDFVKIGISQDPISRVANLRKNIKDFRIIGCFWMNSNLSNTERELHKIYASKRVSFDIAFDGYSEIFHLSETDLSTIKDYIYDKIKQ
jgi:endogenous inhibitor of DNA gyrase (YacG/DUF329 family)